VESLLQDAGEDVQQSDDSRFSKRWLVVTETSPRADTAVTATLDKTARSANIALGI
jgi:hypothetical protein